MLVGDTALTVPISLARPVTCVHVVPSKCQAPRPGPAPELPNAQTSLGLNASASVNRASGRPVECSDTDHWVPFQCRMSPPTSVTAQTSLPESALAAEISLVRPDGRVLLCQLVPFQFSATGVPGAGSPAPLVVPNTQASLAPGATTAE